MKEHFYNRYQLFVHIHFHGTASKNHRNCVTFNILCNVLNVCNCVINFNDVVTEDDPIGVENVLI